MLKIIGILIATLGATILLIVVIGYMLPTDHVAARAILLRRQPADVFALISNFKDEPSWRADVTQVEMLSQRDGHTRFVEKGKNGAIQFEVEESTPPQRIVTRIDGKNLPFGGRWIFEIFPAADGCRLNITERGEVYNPVFRFVSRFILGYTGTIERYLTSVAKKFGESAMPVKGNVAEP
jgi:Polyketide cyclase / dehydrase and lipid transport